MSALPGNSGYYCTQNGINYPSRVDTGHENGSILVGEADQVNGGVLPANLRIFASLDYAINYNLLLGVRFGYTAMGYSAQGPKGATGSSAGAAYTLFPPILIEGRLTYVIGKEALVTKGFAPVVLFGVGAAPFSSGVGVSAFECDNGGMADDPAGSVVNPGAPGSGNPVNPKTHIKESCPSGSSSTSHSVTAWRVGGPFFVAPGGGIRYAFSDRAAFSLNLKLALAFGNGVIFAPTPEATFQYGF